MSVLLTSNSSGALISDISAREEIVSGALRVSRPPVDSIAVSTLTLPVLGVGIRSTPVLTLPVLVHNLTLWEERRGKF